MFRFVIFLLCISLCYALPTNKIVNGTDAELGEFPFMISLQLFGSHSCGASIISENCVLTAAHCVSGYSPSYMTIKYGVIDLVGGSSNTIQVKEIIVRDDYDPANGWRNDLALLILDSPIPFSETVKPVKLPKQGEESDGWTEATLIGWGLPYTGGLLMTRLQKVTILIFPYDRCEEAHGTMVDKDAHVCAGVEGGGKGQCSGDSGGPLIVDGKVMGTVSWSVKPCTIAGYPGVFARVANHVDWIKENVNNNLVYRNLMADL